MNPSPQGWDVAPSNPPLPPPGDTRREDTEQSPSHEAPVGETAQAALERARSSLKRKDFAAARREALACLKADPGNQACQRARVHSYTQQYPMGETKNILGWCLSAFASDLNCLRAMREFHASRGEGVDASGISAEIRVRFPDDELEMPPLPSADEALLE